MFVLFTGLYKFACTKNLFMEKAREMFADLDIDIVLTSRFF